MKNIIENNQTLDDIFNKALLGPILFKNKSLLFPQYTPENILFRNEQIIRLGYLCSSLLKGQKSSNMKKNVKKNKYLTNWRIYVK